MVSFSTGYRYIDSSTPYKAHVGATQTGSSSYSEPFAGFIYSLYIDNTYLSGSSSTWIPTQTGGCLPLAHSSNDCLGEFNFDEYANGSQCDATCTSGSQGCRRAGICHTCDGSSYCHLCFDRECENCSDYSDGSCASSMCASSGFAQEASGSCTCGIGSVRANTDVACEGCHTNCTTCDIGGTGNYSDCTACDTGASQKGIPFNGSYVVCANYCPTTTTDSAICTGSPSAVFGATFALFDTSWTNNSITLTAYDTQPAKDRGNWFNGSAGTRMDFTSDFTLNIDFTLSTWIRVESLASALVLFSKDNDATVRAIAYKTYLNTSGNLVALVTIPTDLSSSELQTSTGTVSTTTWTFVAIAVTLNNSAITMNINFKINDATDDLKTTTNEYFYLDDAVAYKAFVGAQRNTDKSSFEYNFHGFMYGFWVDNTYFTGSSSHYFLP